MDDFRKFENERDAENTPMEQDPETARDANAQDAVSESVQDTPAYDAKETEAEAQDVAASDASHNTAGSTVDNTGANNGWQSPSYSNEPVYGDTPYAPYGTPPSYGSTSYEHSFQGNTYGASEDTGRSGEAQSNTYGQYASTGSYGETSGDAYTAQNTYGTQSENTSDSSSTAYTAGQQPPYAQGYYHYTTVHKDDLSGNNSYQQAYTTTTPTAPNPKKGKSAPFVILCIVLAIVVATASAAVTYGAVKGNWFDGDGSTANTASQTSADSGNKNAPALEIQSTTGKTSGTATSVANKVLPSVVGIVTYSIQSITESGEGSGIIMTSDGYIVTNAHVVSGASKIKVVLHDEKEYVATLIGQDSKTDLAVIKINASGLTAAEFGNSDSMEVGEDVLAIGNPGGLELAGSVTKGIISAKNRDVSGSGYSLKCLQIDAAINPGNSGGALVNMQGQVIGINSSKIAMTGYEGLGFAISINEAKPIIDSLTKYGYVKDRTRIGITCQYIDDIRAKTLDVPTGALVVSVESTSDAAKQGLQKSDIITKVDGKAVEDVTTVTNATKNKKAGDTLTLTVYRYSTGNTFEIKVKLLEDRGDTETTTTSSRQSQNPFGLD